MKRVISTQNAPAAVGPYSQAIEVNDTLYISGQVPIIPATGECNRGTIQEQTTQVLENIKAILTEAGYTLGDVVKTTVLLTDIGDFAQVNAIYASYFTENQPARACYQVAQLPLGVEIEIEAIAAR